MNACGMLPDLPALTLESGLRLEHEKALAELSPQNPVASILSEGKQFALTLTTIKVQHGRLDRVSIF